MEEKTEEKDSYPIFGQSIYEWTFQEYQKGHRSKKWYIIASAAGLILIFGALLSKNFTFALVLILFGIVYFLFEYREPGRINFSVTDLGIKIGRKFFPYSEIINFWIIYTPPDTKNVYFKIDSFTTGLLTVPLPDEVDPVDLREVLLNFLPEDLEQEDMPASEAIGRILKL